MSALALTIGLGRLVTFIWDYQSTGVRGNSCNCCQVNPLYAGTPVFHITTHSHITRMLTAAKRAQQDDGAIQQLV